MPPMSAIRAVLGGYAGLATNVQTYADDRLGTVKPSSGARAREDLVQSIGARLEYGARVGSSLSELWLQGLPLDYFQKYPALLAA